MEPKIKKRKIQEIDQEKVKYFLNLDNTILRLERKAKNFKAGSVNNYFKEWEMITSDKESLNTIKNGLNIVFDKIPIKSNSDRLVYHFSNTDKIKIETEIKNMKFQGVISECLPEPGDYISPIFFKPKNDGSIRIILDLTKVNEHINIDHHKLETFRSALNIVNQNDFFTSLDLKSAYYSIPINKEDKKFLKFYWEDTMYCYNVCPNGLCTVPRIFSKIIRQIMGYLHSLGHRSTFYLDDTLIIGSNIDKCISNTIETLNTFERLGFYIHPHKSIFKPSNKIKYLGFYLDSVSMKVTLTEEKIETILSTIRIIKSKNNLKIRELAKIIGMCIATFPGVRFGPLHYRNMEKDKSDNLKNNKGNYDKKMTLSIKSIIELNWWENHISNSFGYINQDFIPDLIIYTDASKSGWGSVLKEFKTRGYWSVEQMDFSINALELKAIYYSIKSFLHLLDKGNHIRVMTDSMTAVFSINKMGTSHSINCNMITFDIWEMCIENNLWISAAHIKGKENCIADKLSRNFNLDSEWMLNTKILKESIKILNFTPEIDMFATHLNCQFKKFISFYPDPYAIATDAFKFNWSGYKFYAFPPFSIIPRVLKKIKLHQTTGLIVCPHWPSQAFYTEMGEMLIEKPVKISARTTNLVLTNHPEQQHRLSKKLCLLVCLVSGKDIDERIFKTICLHPAQRMEKKH